MTTHDIEEAMCNALHDISTVTGILSGYKTLPDDVREWLRRCTDTAKDALKLERVHTVSFYWRGDNEDTVVRSFLTEDEAWAFVKGEIRKTVKAFEPEEKTHAKTEIDFDEVRKELFTNGYARVEYCGCSAWWHNFMYAKTSPRPCVTELPPLVKSAQGEER